MKKECNIVRDLLPNYIEELLNNDSKEFIETHMKDCQNCRKILEEIKTEKMEEEKNFDKMETEEVSYLKKYKRKKLLLKIILLIFMSAIIILGGGKIINYSHANSIIHTLFQKKQQLIELNNYNLNIKEHSINYDTKQEYFSTQKYYYKDGKYKEVTNGEAIHTKLLNNEHLYFGEINSNKQIQISDENKTIANIVANYNLVSKGQIFSRMYTYLNIYHTDLGFIMNFILRSSFKVRTDRLNGKECYVLRNEYKTSYHEVWIEKERQIPIKEIDDIYGVQYSETYYSFYENTVTDEDVQVPEREGYTIENINNIEDKEFIENWNLFNK